MYRGAPNHIGRVKVTQPATSSRQAHMTEKQSRNEKRAEMTNDGDKAATTGRYPIVTRADVAGSSRSHGTQSIRKRWDRQAAGWKPAHAWHRRSVVLAGSKNAASTSKWQWNDAIKAADGAVPVLVKECLAFGKKKTELITVMKYVWKAPSHWWRDQGRKHQRV